MSVFNFFHFYYFLHFHTVKPFNFLEGLFSTNYYVVTYREEIKVETPSNVFSSDFDITNLKTEFQTDCIELQNVDIKCEINDFDAR